MSTDSVARPERRLAIVVLAAVLGIAGGAGAVVQAAFHGVEAHHGHKGRLLGQRRQAVRRARHDGDRQAAG